MSSCSVHVSHLIRAFRREALRRSGDEMTLKLGDPPRLYHMPLKLISMASSLLFCQAVFAQQLADYHTRSGIIKKQT